MFLSNFTYYFKSISFAVLQALINYISIISYITAMYGTLPVVIVKDPVGNKLTSFHGLSLCNSTSHGASQTVIYSYSLLYTMFYYKAHVIC